MIRNYFKVTYRNLIRQKAYAFINIFGLAIGLTCSILIGLYVIHEYSYDKFHKDSNRLYRIMLDFKMGNNAMAGPISPAPMASEVLKQLPETEDAVRIRHNSNRAVTIENKTFYEDLFFYADSNFFNIFNINFVDGDPATALVQPNSVVLTTTASEKFFGTTNSVGKTFRITNGDTTLYEVSAVVKPLPENSHFHFNILASMSGDADSKTPFWLSNNYYTYLKLKKGTDEKEFNRKLTELFKKNAGPQLLQYFNINHEDFLKTGNRSDYGIQKVTDIHLKSNLNFELEANGSFVYVSIFILVAIFVLLNACINFTNLATARAANRAKEVGLRKVLGSDRKRLIFQFLSESIIISYIAVLLAILMVELLLPHFNNLLNTHLNLYISDYIKLLPYIFVFATIVGIISGGYPAFYLSSFQPNDVLKNKVFKGPSKHWLRNILVIVQFTVSIVILLGTILVATQLRYLQSKNLGFDKEKLMVVERTDPVKNNMRAFLDDLKKCPNIETVSLSTGIPGRENGDQGFMLEGNSTETFVINTYGVDLNYLNTMGIQLVKGRFFSNEFATDSSAVVINESSMRYLGLKNPVGKQLLVPGDGPMSRQKLTIIGVIQDFHYESLHKPVSPLLLFLVPDNFDGYVNVRTTGAKAKDALEFVNLTWKNMAPDAPLQYFYFGDQFGHMYKKEIETQRLMNVFAIIAILIASLGLFGLVAFMADRRTKEIGLRKVLGSSVWEIVKLMTKEITVLVLVSYLVAAPLAYWWMTHWLVHFAYKTPIYWGIFLLAFVIAVLIAWITVSMIAIKAATRNPVESLRYE